MKRAHHLSWHERVRSPLTWHYAGVAILALTVAILGGLVAAQWRFAASSAASIFDGKLTALEALSSETTPLHGLDKQLAHTRTQIQGFYALRIPGSYSLVANRIGELGANSRVRLSRVEYSQGPPGLDLTEVAIDAGVSGDYSQIMRFVNGLERDQVFFVVRAMALTSQQGGIVNLRLRVSTWLRTADAAAARLPMQAADRIARTDIPARGGR